MTFGFRAQQAWTIARLELRRVFFSKRSLWVFLLAFFPALIFFIAAKEKSEHRTEWNAQRTEASRLNMLEEGMAESRVRELAGAPVSEHTYRGRRREPGSRERVQGRYMMYFDGDRQIHLNLEDGVVRRVNVDPLDSPEQDRQVYAGVFQYFYLRLAIFFGCLGIFMNLFRGEMLDKTLHFWFLGPVRRETLLAGKYLAGLMAAVTIFGAGAALSFYFMMGGHPPQAAAQFWQEHGASHLFWYLCAAALACLGYGSLFLAAGLLLRNPILPAITILFWESINGFLPAVLQKLSVLYYVQSLCPVPAPLPGRGTALVRLLLAPAEPAEAWWAFTGLACVTALVLFVAARAVRRLEINYGTD